MIYFLVLNLIYVFDVLFEEMVWALDYSIADIKNQYVLMYVYV